MVSQRRNAGAKRVEIMSIENIGLKASRAMVFNHVYSRIFIFNGVFFNSSVCLFLNEEKVIERLRSNIVMTFV